MPRALSFGTHRSQGEIENRTGALSLSLPARITRSHHENMLPHCAIFIVGSERRRIKTGKELIIDPEGHRIDADVLLNVRFNQDRTPGRQGLSCRRGQDADLRCCIVQSQRDGYRSQRTVAADDDQLQGDQTSLS